LLDGPLRDGAVPAVALLAEPSDVRGEQAPHLVCVAHRVPDEPVDDLDVQRLVIRLELAAGQVDLAAPRREAATLCQGESLSFVDSFVPVLPLRAEVPMQLREGCGVSPRVACRSAERRCGDYLCSPLILTSR